MKLKLHEAIVIALINLDKNGFTASYEEIADYIEQRALYPGRKGGVDFAKQVLLRAD